MTASAGKTALIIGASRGLGYALAAEYVARGWQVTATVRGAGRTGLQHLARSSAGRIVVETVDITVPEQVAALHERLAQDDVRPAVRQRRGDQRPRGDRRRCVHGHLRPPDGDQCAEPGARGGGTARISSPRTARSPGCPQARGVSPTMTR